MAILAAGHGRRMGGPKALREHGGRTFLERILARCRESGSPVIVVADPAYRERIEALLARSGAPGVALAEAAGEAPMLASVQAALARADWGGAPPWHGGFWLWPVDAPFLSAAGWARAREAVRGAPEFVWKLRAGGKTGHPLWLPGWSIPAIRAGAWPDGLLGFLAGCAERVRILHLEGEAIGDVNTPEQLARVPEGL